MARVNWTGVWPGGRICRDRHDREVFVIERQVFDERYTRTLGPITHDEAMAELALFMRDPVGYQTPKERLRDGPTDVVTITAERVKGCLDMLKDEGCTEGHIKEVKSHLVSWTTALEGADLRTVKLLELNKALQKPGMEGARAKRISALKSFTRYLRGKGELEHAADLMLHAPQSVPEKVVRDKGYSADVVQKVYRLIPQQEVRDVIRCRAMTGEHQTEIDRVARGKGIIRRVEGQGEIAGTVAFIHKSGEVHIQSVDADTLAAFERLRSRGGTPDKRWVARQCQLAVKALVKSKVFAEEFAFNPGELRHTFATLAASAGREVKPSTGGLPMELVSATMGHRSTKTTRRHYDMSKIPPMVVVPLQLHHPEDPKRIDAAASTA